MKLYYITRFHASFRDMLEDVGRGTVFSCRFLLIILILLLRGQVIASTNDVDVVIELKHYLIQENKMDQGNYVSWNKSNSPCSWWGITCNDDGRVTGIDLSSSNISGGIFSNFSLLTELTYLDLSENTISGSIPSDLNKCNKLQYLNLTGNILEGELYLTGLTNLRTLDVARNRFQGEIRSNFPAICANLVTLKLSANSFMGEITDCFDQCPKLKYLDLSSNQFIGPIWQGFSYLLEFLVSENNLNGDILSSTFPIGCNLLVMDLAANKLSGIFPSSIANCSNLEVLNVWENEFTGLIPSSIGMLSKLQLLILGSNLFDRNIPVELLNCSQLEFLDLSQNNFSGEIQTIMGSFIMVKYLVLHSNNYIGGIESSRILNLPNVFRLDLSFNNFSGNLPLEIAEMPKLKFLVLSYNNFSGSIPSEYWKISTLQALDLSFNHLSGPIPPTIGKLTSLIWLMLSDNHLTGNIPPEIGNCNSLLYLNLQNNQLNGSIPSELSMIGRNPFSTSEKNRQDIVIGTVGSGECLTLKRWVPAIFQPFNFIYNLMNRKTCRMAWDRILKGYPLVPICLNSSSRVRTPAVTGYIHLSGNQFSGEVPAEIGNMVNISSIQLASNRLSGWLPPAIAGLPIAALNVSNNLFSGEIPAQLGEVQCLQNIDLSMNNFSGVFPESLYNMPELSKFNVSYNPLLSGEIPATGQISTFDNDSFLGDPLITFASTVYPPAAQKSSHDSGGGIRWSVVVYWMFVTVVFVNSGIISFVLCMRVRNPVFNKHGSINKWRT